MRVDLLPFAKRKSKPPPPAAPQFVARLRDEVAEEHVVEQCLASISAERIRVSRRVGPPQSRRSPSQPDGETPASGSFTTRLPPPSPPPFVRPSSTMEVARPAEVRSATPQPPAFVRTTEELAPPSVPSKSSETVAPVARDTKPSERMDLGRPRLGFALGSATVGALVGIVVMRLVVLSQQTEPAEAFELAAPPPAAARPLPEREHNVLRFTDEQAVVIPAVPASQAVGPSPVRPAVTAPPAAPTPAAAPARAKKDELEPLILPDGTLALPGTAHDSRRP